jgi:outer membrane protein OmpA-like peptidoglycan-associated protein
MEFQMPDSTRSTQQLFPLMALLTLLVVATLTLLTLWFKQPVIETDLLQRARQTLTEAGLPPSGLHFSGRDGVLSGTVASEAEASRLVEIASQVYGVRDVDNQLIVASTAADGQVGMLEIPAQLSKGWHVPARQHAVEQIDLSEIQFAYSKAELDTDAMEVLDKVVAQLYKEPVGTVIEVSAHTDSNGTALGNMAVTQARADVVRNYLLSQGINAAQVKAQGYGSALPVAGNDTDAGRKQNRRIEITVLRE